MRKLLICPFFGDLPSWWDQYEAQFPHLSEFGYDFLLDFDLDSFKQRVETILGIDCPITYGSSKIHDYRPALGLLYTKETQEYGWWGHADFDCVWGRLDHFVTDDKLDVCDIWSDCSYDYVGGPFSIYRVGATEDLFTLHPDWKNVLEAKEPTGWMEVFLSQTLKENARDDRDAPRLQQSRNPCSPR